MPCGCNPNDETFDPDHEGPSCADIERFSSETIACPKCKSDVWDGAEWCPECGQPIHDADRIAAPSKNAWFIVAAVAALVGFVVVFVL